MALFSRGAADPAAARLSDTDSVVADLREQLADLRRQVADRESWLSRVTARKVLVHQRNDASVDGLLVGTFPDGIVLRSASLLQAGNQPVPMAGEVWIPREQVAFVQFDG